MSNENNVNIQNSSYVVWKFGGTSQLDSTYKMILNKLNEIKQSNQNLKVVIVLSAISGVTNKLLELVKSSQGSNLMDVIELNYLLASKCNVDIKDIVENFLFEYTNVKS